MSSAFTEFQVLFCAFGCFLAVIVLVICGCHSIVYYIRNRSNIPGPQKKIMYLELMMILFFLLPALSNVFLRHNYFIPYQSEDDFSTIRCKLSLSLTFFRLCGKTTLYAILMYRIYKTFETSVFQINKTIPYLLLTFLSLTEIALGVCWVFTILQN
eukprot:114632_1